MKVLIGSLFVWYLIVRSYDTSYDLSVNTEIAGFKTKEQCEVYREFLSEILASTDAKIEKCVERKAA